MIMKDPYCLLRRNAQSFVLFELTEKRDNSGRVSAWFLEVSAEKQVARELITYGKWYIYGAYLPEYKSRAR